MLYYSRSDRHHRIAKRRPLLICYPSVNTLLIANMNYIVPLIVISPVVLTINVGSAAAPAPRSTFTSAQYANTLTGQDPEDASIKKKRSILKDVRDNGDDRERWGSLVLFSSALDKNVQKMPLVKNENFSIELNPENGVITFSTPQLSHAFKISTTRPGSDLICPSFQVRTVDAGLGYAIINKICPRHKYRQERYFTKSDYYLYDATSSTLRSIWSASTTTSTSSFPSATPEVSVQKIQNGFNFRWTGLYPSDNPAAIIMIDNVYKYEVGKNKKINLVCYDISDPNAPLAEDGTCSGEVVDRFKS